MSQAGAYLHWWVVCIYVCVCAQNICFVMRTKLHRASVRLARPNAHAVHGRDMTVISLPSRLCTGTPNICTYVHICRVGQNHIYTMYIRYFRQGNHQIYGHIRCIYTVLANSTYMYGSGEP